jgi:subtilisin family serine protease
VISGVKNGFIKVIHEYDYIPFMALEVDRAGFEGLQKNPLVVGIEEDILMKPLLAQSVPLINADDVWAAGYTGSGQVVAVLDTGVDKNHPALAGKVVSEACYSTNDVNYGATSLCPGGVPNSTSSNSALPYINNCPTGKCDHGTHVAGIVAAKGPINGVALDAGLIAIQVFSRFDSGYCSPQASPCVLSFTSDQIAGLQRVYELSNSYSISAVNLSLGGDAYTNQATCDSNNSSYKAKVDLLRSVGIVTIAASGNEYSSNSISSPACISSVVSVGATTDADTVASYSNSASFLDLLAPGSSIYSSIPGGFYANYNGTSMAAPHVAGAWALMRSYQPELNNNVLLDVFKNTGKPILDTRNSITKPRIDLLAAAQELTRIMYLPPGNLVASDGTDIDKVLVTWSAKVDADYYQIYRNTKDSTTDAILLLNNPVTNSYNDSSAIVGTLYYYWVKACHELGCSDFSGVDTGWRGYDTIPAPSGVSASDGEFGDKVQVSWYGVGGATNYKIFRNTSNSLVNATLLAEPTTLLYDDFSALSNMSYYYWLQACNLDVCSDHSISDVGTTNNIHNIFLPLILKNGVASTDPIKNGNFELGRDGSWTEYSSKDNPLILSQDILLVGPHSGSWAGWLGGDVDETSRLSQNVTISSSGPYLHFWYWIASGDTVCGDDVFRLKINNSEVTKHDLCTSTNTSGWVERVVNLSSYAGSTVTLMFEVTTDFALNSNFFLDDVSMSNVATTSTAVIDGLQDLGDVTRSRTK